MLGLGPSAFLCAGSSPASSKVLGGCRSGVDRMLCKHEVIGSNPITSIEALTMYK